MAKKQQAEKVHIPEVIDVQPENPDQALIAQDGQGVVGFIQGLRQFMAGAAEIEKNAQASLESAKTWTKPTSKAEAERIQQGIRQATQDIKQAGDYWTITSLMSRLHKRLVAHRDRPVEMLEEVKRLGNVQVNWWNNEQTRLERERADAERRQQEQEARERRERELADLEAAAIRSEEGSPDLSARETAFVDEYLRNNGRGQQAAQYAGYKDPIGQASRLLSTEKIKAAILAKQQAEQLRKQATAQRAMPIEVEVETRRPPVTKGTRTTWGAEVIDRDAFIAAVFEGKHGIPRDVLMIDESRVRKYGEQLQALVDKWPGVRHTKKTTTV